MIYLVRWSLHVEADSPEEAARLAREVQLDPRSPAITFLVGDVEDAGKAIRVNVNPDPSQGGNRDEAA